MDKCGLDGFLVCKERNVQYLTGKSTGRALVLKDDAILWVKDIYSKIYSETYSQRTYPYSVREVAKDAIKKFIDRQRIRKLGVENVGVLEFQALTKSLKPKLVPCDLVEGVRAVKSKYELDLLRKSADMAKKGMKKAYDVVGKGVSEVDAVAEIEAAIRRLGSETPPFDDGMLLASGKSSADIHARAQKKRIVSGSLVVVDLGARYGGYYSDMTRTIPVGRIGRKEKELMEFVDNLRDETIDWLQVGMKASEVHERVEKRIERRGYKFYHSTGHGVGLNVHESPNLSSVSDDVLAENMVFTIEPGIYIPGKYGIRFEDTLILGKRKKENITGM
jgi:Xaa-Pro aminopeptidase